MCSADASESKNRHLLRYLAEFSVLIQQYDNKLGVGHLLSLPDLGGTLIVQRAVVAKIQPVQILGSKMSIEHIYESTSSYVVFRAPI
jgi:hypothetical protein